jgi:hypothetical protein
VFDGEGRLGDKVGGRRVLGWLRAIAWFQPVIPAVVGAKRETLLAFTDPAN